ncbi:MULTISPECIES: hypothetical protein [Kitasatospora]|jgi:hypothetical protein|uniref:Uncharacterized protein n=1 Tax=Kitasatospora acidiphila TaxID=2567942 RepID=A0A540W3P9_9ACTN|nr:MULTISPECIES: hypothetical protein [Kitasatospora]MCC9310834.1 hypothetical protein [Kitasatospora humi]MDH6143991.1 hypothetical protein [Kitasatospora sp. GP30]TQF03656.1 hypothetical protein E6W39_17245 [Kitasatospora acidiphila]
MSNAVNLSHAVVTLAVDDNKVTPGLLGFVVFAVLGVATWFLLKSMNSRFKKIDFVEEGDSAKE